MKFPRSVLLLLLLPAAAVRAQAPLDDSLSPRQQVRAELEWSVPLWRARGASEKAFTSMTATVPNLDIRLDTSDYHGRRARVFMTVPLPVQGLRGSQGLRINWRSDGLFEDGTLVPGQRALVYDGPVDGPVLRDRLHLEIELDGNAATGSEIRFEPKFQIEPR